MNVDMNLAKIEKILKKAFPGVPFTLSANQRGILTLSGDCENWNQVVELGHLAAKQPGVVNVVNHLSAAGKAAPKKDYTEATRKGEAIGPVANVDVLIIGAGISGCGIARQLAKYKLDIMVIDAADDVATGATKANNGNIHPGHAVKPGTLKAKLNVEGNRMYTQWAQELGFELQRCGAMGFITNPLLKFALRHSYNTAVKNGVDGVEIVNGQRACQLEPGIARAGLAGKVKAALWLPSMGLVEPYKVAVALAENAAQNGVRFWFNCTACGVQTNGGAVQGVVTNKGIISAKCVINCAGVYADEISAMAGDECYTIHPRRGVIAILDKAARPKYDSLCSHIDFNSVKQSLKPSQTKGGGMCRTPEWNVLMGPSAVEIPDKEDLSTSGPELAYAMGRSDGSATYGNVIRFFAGNRPADYKEDFVIGMSGVTRGFINVGGIQSPGLAAAPAIARMVEEIVADFMPLAPDESYNPVREREVEFRNMTHEQQDELIRKDPAFGRVICRCESITEGEILQAIRSPVPPASIDAIKRRTRAGMGRCQGGFCQPRVLEILAREQHKSKLSISLKGEGTEILLKENRGAGADVLNAEPVLSAGKVGPV